MSLFFYEKNGDSGFIDTFIDLNHITVCKSIVSQNLNNNALSTHSGNHQNKRKELKRTKKKNVYYWNVY